MRQQLKYEITRMFRDIPGRCAPGMLCHILLCMHSTRAKFLKICFFIVYCLIQKKYQHYLSQVLQHCHLSSALHQQSSVLLSA